MRGLTKPLRPRALFGHLQSVATDSFRVPLIRATLWPQLRGRSSMDESQRITLGVILLILGVLSIWVGGTKVPVKGGAVLKTFSSPSATRPWFRWLIGAALIFAGVAVVFQI